MFICHARMRAADSTGVGSISFHKDLTFCHCRADDEPEEPLHMSRKDAEELLALLQQALKRGR